MILHLLDSPIDVGARVNAGKKMIMTVGLF